MWYTSNVKYAVKNHNDQVVCESNDPNEAKRRAFMAAHFNKEAIFVLYEGDAKRQQFYWQPLTRCTEMTVLSPIGGLSFND